MKIRKDYRLEPDLVEWVEKKADSLDRDETWVIEFCIREQKNKEPEPGSEDELR